VAPRVHDVRRWVSGRAACGTERRWHRCEERAERRGGGAVCKMGGRMK
jgi:hypothetical protein